MKVMGIDFITWNELTSASYYKEVTTATLLSVLFVYGPVAGVALFCYLLFYKHFILVLLYTVWLIYDKETPKKGGLRNTWFRNLYFTRYIADYFPSKIIKEERLKENENYLVGTMPHGAIVTHCGSLFCSSSRLASKNFPGFEFRPATLDLLFMTPFYRDLALAAGLISCSEKSLCHYLGGEKNKVAVVVPGGVAELLLSCPGTYRLKLKHRKGFIRIALMTGSHLVPMFCFEENDLFVPVIPNPPGSMLHRIQTFIGRYFAFLLGLFIFGYGRGFFQKNIGLTPHKMPLHIIVGKPIYLTKIQNPTAEDVNKYHKLFVEAIIDIFERYKYKYLKEPESARIEFV